MHLRSLMFATAAAILSMGTAAHAASSDSSQVNQIKQNWEAFFAPTTPTDKRVQLLQGGQEFKKSLQQGASRPMAKESQAKVGNIQVQGDQARVTFTIDVAGQPTLTNIPGTAVKENGTWKVSRQTFCQLEMMSPSPAPECVSGGGGH